MRQILGFLIIIACFPLLMSLMLDVRDELTLSQSYADTMSATIDLPPKTPTLPIQMLDRDDVLFNEEYIEWIEPLPLQQIPPVMQQLFVLSEDTEFYAHKGFDVSAIVRAFVVNSGEQEIQQGASTITQQLVRMRYLTAEKSYERKLTELFFAYNLEKKHSKEQILEMYLNEMYFGNQVYGVGGAATFYFSRPLAELSVAELAFLAAIPNNPSLYNPLQHFDQTKSRQERLLHTLATHGILNKQQLEEAIHAPITLQLKEKQQQYPAYSTYVMQELRWLVAKEEGLDVLIAQATTDDEKEALQLELTGLVNSLLQQGVIIHTALHPAKQQADEAAITAILGEGELQASAAVIDNETREIVSVYAGKHYEKLNLHRAYQTPRQPGSSFKPLSVYAPYIELEGANATSMVSGANICIGTFCPQNYGGVVYGNTSLATAFQYSANTTAVRLLQRIGIDTSMRYLQQFRFRSLVPIDETYAALALGGLTYGVTTLEMADAYTSFIDGYYTPTHAIRSITNAAGDVLYSAETARQPIWSTKTVNTMRQLLQRVVTSGTGVGLYSRSSYLGAKTGTTNDYRDFWLAGLNDTYTTAVWIGYDQPRSMEHLERAQLHFKIFNTIMNNE